MQTSQDKRRKKNITIQENIQNKTTSGEKYPVYDESLERNWKFFLLTRQKYDELSLKSLGIRLIRNRLGSRLFILVF